VRETLLNPPVWLRRLTALGGLSSDSEELRLRKAVLVLSCAGEGRSR
jgi:hypothetical protein